ncbi:MAG TPA: alkaline phosphatase PhoX [Burkholderiales bacterium]
MSFPLGSINSGLKLESDKTRIETKEPSRRSFLKGGAALSGAAVISAATLGVLAAHTAQAGEHGQGHGSDRKRGRRAGSSYYGEVSPKPDQHGDAILALPRDFEYVTFSRTGSPLSDGSPCPSRHDGMAAFDGPGRTIRLIRNHEIRNNPAASFPFPVTGPTHTRYDDKAMGGTVTVDFDPRRKRVVREFVSCNGTLNNCAGGYAYRNAGWITSEENTGGVKQGYLKPHGYNFFVSAHANSAVKTAPLKWMGRMAHEAALADVTGVLYETEDSGNNSGFYRALPNDRRNLEAGGRLQMLALKETWQANMYVGQTVGKRLAVQWVDIAMPDPDLENGAPTCFRQGRDNGAAAFNRLEGIYLSQDGRSVYFLSTSGGDAKYGQLWHYIPADGKYTLEDQLVLVFESPDGSVLDSPDNLCISPRGGILFQEDDASGDNDTHPLASGMRDINRLVGMGRFGELFEFALNVHSESEFCGATWSPDGEILFVNLQGGDVADSGMTLAIWGPWERGPL